MTSGNQGSTATSKRSIPLEAIILPLVLTSICIILFLVNVGSDRDKALIAAGGFAIVSGLWLKVLQKYVYSIDTLDPADDQAMRKAIGTSSNALELVGILVTLSGLVMEGSWNTCKIFLVIGVLLLVFVGITIALRVYRMRKAVAKVKRGSA